MTSVVHDKHMFDQETKSSGKSSALTSPAELHLTSWGFNVNQAAMQHKDTDGAMLCSIPVWPCRTNTIDSSAEMYQTPCFRNLEHTAWASGLVTHVCTDKHISAA